MPLPPILIRPTYTPETQRLLHLVEAAEGYLADYRTENQPTSQEERLRLCGLIADGWAAADAAEQVQAESTP